MRERQGLAFARAHADRVAERRKGDAVALQRAQRVGQLRKLGRIDGRHEAAIVAGDAAAAFEERKIVGRLQSGE